MISLGAALLTVTLQTTGFTSGLDQAKNSSTAALNEIENKANLSANKVGKSFETTAMNTTALFGAMNTGIGDFGKSTIDAFDSTVVSAETSVEAINTAFGDLDFSAPDAAQAFADEVAGMAESAQASLEEMGGSAEDAGSSIGQAFQDGIGDADALLEDLAGKAGAAFGALTNPVVVATAAMAAFGAAVNQSIDVAADFEAQMSGVGAIVNGTAEEMKNLENLALDMGSKTSFSASQAAEGIEELGKAGVSTTDIIGGGLQGALSLAASTGMKDLGAAAEIASNAMNTFSLGGKDVGMVADVISNAANTSALSVEDWAASLQAAGPVVAQSNIKLEEFSAIMSLMANNALTGSDAGTSLKTMLMALQAPSDQAGKTLKTLGINIYDAHGKMMPFTSIAKDLPNMMKKLETGFAGLSDKQRNQAAASIFGADGIRAFNILMKEGSGNLEEMTKAMAIQGSATESAEKRLDNYRGAQEQMGGAIETLAINFGTLFLPTVTAATKELTVWIGMVSNAVSWIRNLIDAVRETVKPYIDVIKNSETFKNILEALKIAIAIVAGGTGLVLLKNGLMIIVSTIRAAVMPTITALIASLSPILVPIAAISLAVGALYVAWKKNFLGLHDLTDDFVKQAEVMLARIPLYFDAVKTTLTILGQVFGDVFGGIGKILQGAAGLYYIYVIQPVMEMGKEVGKRLLAVGEVVKGWVEAIYGFFKPLLDFFAKIGVKIGDFAMTVARNALDGLRGKAKDAGEEIRNLASSTEDSDEVNKALDKMAEGFDQIGNAGKGAAGKIKDAWSTAITEANKITATTLAAEKAAKEAAARYAEMANAADVATEKTDAAVTRTVDLETGRAKGIKITTDMIKKLIPEAERLVSALTAAEGSGNKSAIQKALLDIDKFKRAYAAAGEAISLVQSAQSKSDAAIEAAVREQNKNAEAVTKFGKAMRDLGRDYQQNVKNQTLTTDKANDFAFALIDLYDEMVKLPPAYQAQLAAQYQQMLALNKSSEATVKAIEANKLLKNQVEPMREALRKLAADWKQDLENKTINARKTQDYEEKVAALYKTIKSMPAAVGQMLQAEMNVLTQMDKASVAMSAAIKMQEDYDASVKKLTKSVNNWTRAELLAAKARAGNDQNKLAVINARLAEIDAAGLDADAAISAQKLKNVKAETDSLQSEYDRRMKAVKDNAQAQQVIEMTLGVDLMKQKKILRQAEYDAEVEATKKSFRDLIDKNKYDSAKVRELRTAEGLAIKALDQKLDDDLQDIEDAHTDKLAKIVGDRNESLAALDSDARKKAREQTLQRMEDQIKIQEGGRAYALERAEQEITDSVKLAEAKLRIEKDFEGIFRRQKIDYFNERQRLETEQENERYKNLIDDLTAKGLYTAKVEEDQKSIHLGIMAKIQSDHDTDQLNALTEMEGTVRKAQDVLNKAIQEADKAAKKAQADAAKELAQKILDSTEEQLKGQLDGVKTMSGAVRDASIQALKDWAMATTGAKTYEEAMLQLKVTAPEAAGKIEAAIKKIGDASVDAGTKFKESLKTFNTNAERNYTPAALSKIGKTDEEGAARSKAESPYFDLINKVKDDRAKLVDAFNELSADDQKKQLDIYTQKLAQADTFIATVTAKMTAAGTEAVTAFNNAQADAIEKSRVDLSKAQFDVGLIDSKAMNESLEKNKAYWQTRIEALKKIPGMTAEVQKAEIEVQKILKQQKALLEDKDAIEKSRLDLSKAQFEAGTIDLQQLKASYATNQKYWESKLAALKAEGGSLEDIAKTEIEIQKIIKAQNELKDSKDAIEKSRLDLSKAQYDVELITYQQMLDSVRLNRTFWEEKVAALKAQGAPLEEIQKAQIELEKTRRMENDITTDHLVDNINKYKAATDAAEKGYKLKFVTEADYKKALQDDLNYNRTIVKNSDATSEMRSQALERIYDIEAKLKDIQITNSTKLLKRVSEVMEYASQGAEAIAGLAGALGNSNAEANLNGLAKAFNFVKDSAQDVMKIMANPADIGSWVRLGVRIVNTIADAINGFRKAREEMEAAKKDFNSQFSLVDGNQLAKYSLKSRGFFADIFGGGPEVVKQINEAAVKFAKTLESGVTSALTNSVRAFLTVSDEELKKLNMTAQEYAVKSLREGIKEAVLTAVIDAVIQAAVIKGKLGQLLTDLSTALGAGDMNLAQNIIKNIGAAIPGVINALTPLMNQFRETMQTAFPDDMSIDADVNTDVGGLTVPAELDMPASVQVIAMTPIAEKFDSLAKSIDKQVGSLDSLTMKLDELINTGFKHSFDIKMPNQAGNSDDLASAMRYSS